MADPVLNTSNVGIDQSTQTAYTHIPPGADLTPVGGGGGAPSMGTAQAVTSGETLPAGNWIFTTGTAQLIVSDGTATAPAAGNIYEFT